MNVENVRQFAIRLKDQLVADDGYLLVLGLSDPPVPISWPRTLAPPAGYEAIVPEVMTPEMRDFFASRSPQQPAIVLTPAPRGVDGRRGMRVTYMIVDTDWRPSG